MMIKLAILVHNTYFLRRIPRFQVVDKRVTFVRSFVTTQTTELQGNGVK